MCAYCFQKQASTLLHLLLSESRRIRLPCLGEMPQDSVRPTSWAADSLQASRSKLCSTAVVVHVARSSQGVFRSRHRLVATLWCMPHVEATDHSHDIISCARSKQWQLALHPDWQLVMLQTAAPVSAMCHDCKSAPNFMRHLLAGRLGCHSGVAVCAAISACASHAAWPQAPAGKWGSGLLVTAADQSRDQRSCAGASAAQGPGRLVSGGSSQAHATVLLAFCLQANIVHVSAAITVCDKGVLVTNRFESLYKPYATTCLDPIPTVPR